MKRILSLFTVLLLILSLSIPVSAVDTSRSYEFDLTVNGDYKIFADPGDIITLTLRLKRTDSQESALMYAMQDEINYDSTFFELVEGGAISASGIENRDLALRDEYRAYYMNFVDMGGGKEWQADTMIGTFQLKIVGTTGSSVIANKNYVVSTQDGSDGYTVTANDVTIILTLDCTIRFETNGGSEIADMVVEAGQKLSKPADPIREGYTFAGWYRDMDLQEPWDFDTDIVEGNMTLYAKWTEGEATVSFGWWIWIIIGLILLGVIFFLLILFGKKTVTFETYGGSEVYKRRVNRNQVVKKPMKPHKEGCTFGGWYKDPTCLEPWDFENDTIKKNLTLYAKWK